MTKWQLSHGRKTLFPTPVTSKNVGSVGLLSHRASLKYLAWLTDGLTEEKPDSFHWALATVQSQHQLCRTKNDMVSLFSISDPRLFPFIQTIFPLINLIIFSLTLQLYCPRGWVLVLSPTRKPQTGRFKTSLL